jgi:hypothetical protein
VRSATPPHLAVTRSGDILGSDPGRWGRDERLTTGDGVRFTLPRTGRSTP